jgi:peptidoglycan-associated lipoprotein
LFKEQEMRIWKLMVPFCALIIVGCASKSGTEVDSTGGGSADADDSAVTSGEGDRGMGGVTALDPEQIEAIMNDRVIYFEYDSTKLDSATMDLLKLHGAYLAQNPGQSVRLEGHADERGSREYNIGLGERRAVAVRSVLTVQGASSSQIDVISFGEEKPATNATGEAAWAQNRRVEINYR